MFARQSSVKKNKTSKVSSPTEAIPFEQSLDHVVQIHHHESTDDQSTSILASPAELVFYLFQLNI